MANEKPPYASGFSEVLVDELNLIRRRRKEILREELKRQEKDVENSGDVLELKADADSDARLTQARLLALDEHLTGISFSGGGIRSGTFAVGLLQGLSSLGLLRRFDYLSTVSGGGYAGGWLASWLKRDGDVRNVERQLAPSRVRQGEAYRDFLNPPPGDDYPTTAKPVRGPVVDEEPEPIYHLRSYSSYMAPQLGLLTADTWTIIMIWLRNVSVNLMMFLPLGMVVVLAARLLLNLYGSLTSERFARSTTFTVAQWISFAPLGAGILLLFFVFSYNGRALMEFRRRPLTRPWKDEGKNIYYRMVYPTLLAALGLSLGLRPVIWCIGDRVKEGTDAELANKVPKPPLSLGAVWDWIVEQFGRDLGILGVPNIVGHALAVGAIMMVGALFVNVLNGTFGDGERKRLKLEFLWAALIAGATGGVLLTVAEQFLTVLSDAGQADLVAMLGAPTMLLVLAAALIVEVALLGRSITEAEREWWSRFGALVLISALLWVLAFATILYVPALFLGIGLPVRLLIASGWLGTIVAGVVAGRNVRPAKTGGSGVLGVIAAVAPPIFMVGILGALALLGAFLVNDPQVVFPAAGSEDVGIANYLRGVRNASFPRILAWLALFGVLAWMGSTLIDVNLFSLNAMYANRLIRCYLGATRRKARWADRWGGLHDCTVLSGAPTEITNRARDPNPVTGFDPEDDLDLLDLRISYNAPQKEDHRTYWGPQVLINTSLNLVGGDELAWRDRKGESFTLSPLYCGSKGTGYALVGEGTRKQLTLGRAMSISGAAVDPNMRFYQSASLTAFLTLLNARLGYWIQNPSRWNTDPKKRGWTAESPKLANLLFTELLGRTVGKGEFIHLSDGGHFENMGVYELIRRRCRYIVACDAGEDTGPSDENLAILMRLVRIDFGVRIKIDTEPFRAQGPDGLTRAHVVVGRVHYEDVDSGQLPGILVYVRISMTGDEPSDVQQYARSAPAFPHQPTDLKQSFTEEQFESYRALGEHIAHTVFKEAATNVQHRFWTEADPRREFVQGNRRLFSAIQGRWATPPTDQNTRFVEATKAWLAFQRDLRKDAELSGLATDAFPELQSIRGMLAVPESQSDQDNASSPNPPVPKAGTLRAEMHAVGQLLLIMEDAWLELGLSGQSNLPMNRGWINALRRWVGTAAFQLFWPVFRSQISPDFVRFLEDELHLATSKPTIRRLSEVKPQSLQDDSLKILSAEFDREWPDGDARGRDLDALKTNADSFQYGGKPPVWLLIRSPSGPKPSGTVAQPDDELPQGSFVGGVVMLLKDADPDAYELFAWVRRPHRASGLGTSAIGPLIDEILSQLKKDLAEKGGTKILRVYYPKSGEEGDNDMERERWMSFFALYDFHPEAPEVSIRREFSVAVLKIEVPKPGATH